MKKYLFLFITSAFLFTGCYHAQITTGLQPSAETYENKWATGWLFGLVGPDRIQGAEECTTGSVATVETKLSFLNQLASAITFGIFTPMHITVTCASSSAGLLEDERAFEITEDDDRETVEKTFSQAVSASAETKEPAYIYFK